MSRENAIGTWRLVSSEMRMGDQVVYPLGKDCQGILVLDQAGNLAAQLMNPDRCQFADNDIQGGTPEEIEQAYRGYVAFWGRYQWDESRQVLEYTVQGSLFPNWIGHPQRRQFELDGDRLTLTTTPIQIQGAEVVGVLVWRKAGEVE